MKFRVDQMISFSNKDYIGISTLNDDAIADYTISKILIDSGSSVDIMFQYNLHRMDLQGMQMESCMEATL